MSVKNRLSSQEQVKKGKEKEVNLSEEDKALLFDYIDHQARILERKLTQKEKEQLFSSLIKNKYRLKQATRDEKAYQALPPAQRRLSDYKKVNPLYPLRSYAISRRVSKR